MFDAYSIVTPNDKIYKLSKCTLVDSDEHTQTLCRIENGTYILHNSTMNNIFICAFIWLGQPGETHVGH